MLRGRSTVNRRTVRAASTPSSDPAGTSTSEPAVPSRRTRLLATSAAGLVGALGLSLMLAGCGGGSSAAPTATHTMADGSVMSGSSMAGMDHSGDPSASSDPSASAESDGMTSDSGGGAGGPSESSTMICSDEIAGAVRRNLELKTDPVGLHSWSDRLYSCTYQLAAGDLRLSVKDLDAAGPGRAYYDGLHRRLPGASAIRGLANFGFPAFETPRGDVVFIKDHKTLWVDASRLRPSALPSGASRQDVAYGVAAAVIGCWTE